MPDWCQEKAGGIVSLTLYIQPGAKKTELCGEHGGALKIRLAAPPVEGKANLALLRFLADHLQVSKSAVSLITGDTNRHKRVEIQGLSAATVTAALLITP